MTKPVFILRWIAVLPGALLAAILVGLIFQAVNALGAVNFLASIVQFPADPNVGAAQFVMGTSYGIAYAATFVLLGEWIAPGRKTTTRFVLAALLVLLSGLSVIMIAIGSSPGTLLSEFQYIATPCTGIYLLVKAWRDLN